MLAWAFAPTIPLIMLAYVLLAVGNNFLTGADDAFFYEWLQITGRTGDYPRLVGRVSAIMLGALALGSAASGLLATFDLLVPFLIAGLSFLILLGIVLTFKEPQTEKDSAGQARKPYREILQQSIAIMRARPTLRYPLIISSLMALAALHVLPALLLIAVISFLTAVLRPLLMSRI